MMWVRSFISHFKKIVLFAAVVVAVTEGMNYLYLDDTQEFARCMMHEFYENRENIDRLYLGSSHVFCDIDPVILDGINMENNFNLATSMQQLNTSYFLLREADGRNEIDRVYLDLAYQCTSAGPGNLHDYKWIPKSWFVQDQMRPSLNKLAYMLDLSGPEYYYITFLPFMRYREKLFDWEHVAGTVKGKQTEEWKNYEYTYTTPEGETVRKRGGKGFRIYYGTLEHGNFYAGYRETGIEENPMTLESMEYLEKIVAYCRERDIELTWISSPTSDFELVHKGGYDNYIRQVRELAESYGVPYYDFNLCRREYLDLGQGRYWFDMGHMNRDGAEVYSQFLGSFLKAQETGEDTYGDCFYDSYEEKLESLPEEIFGLQFVPSQDYERFMPEMSKEQCEEYVIYLFRPVTNAPDRDMDIDIEIHVTGKDDTEREEDVQVMRDGGEAYVIRSIHEHGVMNVTVKFKDTVEEMRWEQIVY